MSSDAYNAAEIGGSASPSSPAGTCPMQAKEIEIGRASCRERVFRAV